MAHFKTLLPFSALAITFIILGIILNDIHQIYFGFVWLFFALLAFIIKKVKHNNHKEDLYV